MPPEEVAHGNVSGGTTVRLPPEWVLSLSSGVGEAQGT